MKVEMKELMSHNDMLSHIFLGCIHYEDLIKIQKKFIGDTDWKKESAKIPVEMKIGGVHVNPKQFFDNWKDQMEDLILEKAQELVAEKLSNKALILQDRFQQIESVLKDWESEINWDVKNPLL